MSLFRRVSAAAAPGTAALALLCSFGSGPPAALAIPAAPLMTVYQFNGSLSVPYYAVADFKRRGRRAKPAGFLAQGSSVVPCLVVYRGKPLTDGEGTPYVGFETVVDSRKASPQASNRFRTVSQRQESQRVPNHHCAGGERYVISARRLYQMDKVPFFDPGSGEPSASASPRGSSKIDEVVRAFHNSAQCRTVQRTLLERRAALEAAWKSFARENGARWPKPVLDRARHLDYVMRTALFEGHLERGCGAYGACERNVIALSLRNRALERCSKSQGCRHRGDFRGVAAKISQYNIWDEVLTQISGLGSCFLRDDLAGKAPYTKLRAMYAQSQSDIERIMFGSPTDLEQIFPGTPLSKLTQLRHYYHPPAMGKCFPNQPRIEYISGATARRGEDFALIADTRVKVGAKRGAGYEFERVSIHEEEARDIVTSSNDYRGFLLDNRKVSLRKPRRCAPYGTPRGCRFAEIRRHRKTPGWLSAGKPLQLNCEIVSRGTSCRETPRRESVMVGGVCDVAMQPIGGVP